MSPKKKQTEDKEQGCQADCSCPLCALMDRMKSARGRRKSLQHFYNAQMEFLAGMRAVIDETMEWMEKGQPAKEPKVTKIVVE